MKSMKKLVAGALAALAVSSSSCGTVNGVRWAYGMPSVYEQPEEFSESVGIRAMFGGPVIVSGLAFDAVTFPAQIIFGVWPWWGSASTMMDPR